MCKFGIKIDLSVFFNDERKLIMLLLDNNWKTVECLQKRIQHLYEVSNILLINNDGYLLHPSESIDIVRLCSHLKGIIPSENVDASAPRLHKTSKNKSKSVKHDGCHQKSEEITTVPMVSDEATATDNVVTAKHKMKRKFCWLDNTFNTSTPIGNSNQVKRIKGSKDASIQINLLKKQFKQASNEITSTSEVSEQSDLQQLQSINGAEDIHEINENENENEKSSSRQMKKKKSINSDTSQPNCDVSIIVNDSHAKKPKHQTTLNLTLQSDIPKSSKGSKATQHIYFNEDGTTADEVVISNDTIDDVKSVSTAATTSTQCNSINTTARFHCSLEDNLNQQQARKFQCKSKRTKAPEKNPITIKKIIVIRPANGNTIQQITTYPTEEKLLKKEEIDQTEGDLTFSSTADDPATNRNNDKVEKDDQKIEAALAKETDQKMDTVKDETATVAVALENSNHSSKLESSDFTTAKENENENNKTDAIFLENKEIVNQKTSSNASDTSQTETTEPPNCDANKSLPISNKTLNSKPKDLEEVKTVLLVEKPGKQSPLKKLIDAFTFSGLASTMNESTVVSIDDDSDVGEISEIIDLNESDNGSD